MKAQIFRVPKYLLVCTLGSQIRNPIHSRPWLYDFRSSVVQIWGVLFQNCFSPITKANQEHLLVVFIEPISKNIDMYVPAYPLPLMEIASFVKSNIPGVDLGIISIPMDYGLPLTRVGRDQIYRDLTEDIRKIRPDAVGISCTSISQAEEVIHLCNIIKTFDPDIFLFLGGYFPTIYYEEILRKTSAVDLVVVGEGEVPALHIIELLGKGKNPRTEDIPNLAWKRNGQIHETPKGNRFNLKIKACLNHELLKYPKAYDIMPYAFSRGCPYKCNFCMEDHIRPSREEVPTEIIEQDLTSLLRQSSTRTLLISDALFKSFGLFPLLRSLDTRVIFETRSDVLTPSILHEIKDLCEALALGFESASYSTLRRMNKVRDQSHYREYVSNTFAIFREACSEEIPIMVFMIAGYPGDTEEDLQESLLFAQELSKHSGPGGHIFKIGECRAYPKTKLHDHVLSSPDVVFDDDGVFGENTIRQPSKGLNFETIRAYMKEIFNLSNQTPKLQRTLRKVMPFFRFPVFALRDDMIPSKCFKDGDRNIFDVSRESLAVFKEVIPMLAQEYKDAMSDQRKMRDITF